MRTLDSTTTRRFRALHAMAFTYSIIRQVVSLGTILRPIQIRSHGCSHTWMPAFQAKRTSDCRPTVPSQAAVRDRRTADRADKLSSLPGQRPDATCRTDWSITPRESGLRPLWVGRVIQSGQPTAEPIIA